MFIRFSSDSKVYNIKLIGNDVILSWNMPLNLSDFNAISLNSFHLGKSKQSARQYNLCHLSSNIVQSSVSNPNGTILSFSGDRGIVTIRMNQGNDTFITRLLWMNHIDESYTKYYLRVSSD